MADPDPRDIRLTEAEAVPGLVVAADLGPVTARIAPQLLRGVIATGRAAEAALRQAARTRGATHVLRVRMRLELRLWGQGATATGRAVRLCPAPGPD